MGQRPLAIAILSALVIAAAVAPGGAQNQPQRSQPLPPPGGQQPQRSQPLPPPQRPAQPPQPQAAAPKPYKPVAITMPAPVSDPSFEPFRKQLAEIVQKKDRKALAALVASNFFWMGEKGDKAAKGRPGIDNLAKAVDLDSRDGSGWEALDAFVADPTGTPFPDRPNTICAPAEPQYNAQEFEQLVQATGASDEDWAYPVQPGLEMRAGPQPSSPVVEKLGMHFVLILEDNSPANLDGSMLRVAAPSGKAGYVPFDAVAPLINDQICYVKQGAAWKIAGYIGEE